MAVIYAKESDFASNVESGLTLVDFYADWCGPCKMIAPILDELSGELTDVKIVKINVDSEQALSEKYKIMSIPTLMVFKDGEPVSTKTGFQSKDMLINWINENK